WPWPWPWRSISGPINFFTIFVFTSTILLITFQSKRNHVHARQARGPLREALPQGGGAREQRRRRRREAANASGHRRRPPIAGLGGQDRLRLLSPRPGRRRPRGHPQVRRRTRIGQQRHERAQDPRGRVRHSSQPRRHLRGRPQGHHQRSRAKGPRPVRPRRRRLRLMGCGFFKLWLTGRFDDMGYPRPEFDADQGASAVKTAGGTIEMHRGRHTEKVVLINLVEGTTLEPQEDDQRFVVDGWCAGKFDLDVPKFLTAAAATVEMLGGPKKAEIVVP
ncbi:hypothetical protein ACHAWF_001757, partial [Thalassiosira exigua]